jgi:hypothetical protein
LRENVVATETRAQAVISNRQASDRFTCKWSLARDLNKGFKPVLDVGMVGHRGPTRPGAIGVEVNRLARGFTAG